MNLLNADLRFICIITTGISNNSISNNITRNIEQNPRAIIVADARLSAS